jgi:hypothetical protein
MIFGKDAVKYKIDPNFDPYLECKKIITNAYFYKHTIKKLLKTIRIKLRGKL